MEIELNGTKLRVYEDGQIKKWFEYKNGEKIWRELKGTIVVNKDNYKLHKSRINKKGYTTSRIIYYAFNPTWDINDLHFNNTIDHINRDSLDNRIDNLRIATAKEQALNRNIKKERKNIKGYTWKNNSWRAQIKIDKKSIHLGSFNTKEEAHQAYLKAKESYQSK